MRVKCSSHFSHSSFDLRTNDFNRLLPPWKEACSSTLPEICDLLALEHPEIRIERLDGRLIDTEGNYSAAAYFKSDPFLARAGAIGQIKSFSGSQRAVHEACAWGVYDYLIDMVREDMALEEKITEEREAITQWGQNAAK